MNTFGADTDEDVTDFGQEAVEWNADRYPEEMGWLVEMMDGGRPTYWSYEATDEDSPWGGFDPDVNKATRFARKRDADACIAAYGWTPGHVYAAEHTWGGEKIKAV